MLKGVSSTDELTDLVFFVGVNTRAEVIFLPSPWLTAQPPSEICTPRLGLGLLRFFTVSRTFLWPSVPLAFASNAFDDDFTWLDSQRRQPMRVTKSYGPMTLQGSCLCRCVLVLQWCGLGHPSRGWARWARFAYRFYTALVLGQSCLSQSPETRRCQISANQVPM